jgi:hypothetical protein
MIMRTCFTVQLQVYCIYLHFKKEDARKYIMGILIQNQLKHYQHANYQ